MQPRPERHARVEGEDHIVGRATVTPPRRPDDEPPADPQDREVRLPGLGPVSLVDEPGLQVADRAQPERLQVAERLGHLGHRPVCRGPVARRHVRANGRGPARIDAGAEALLDQIERGFHRGAAGCDAAQDLADRLDGFHVGLDRELEPRARRALVAPAGRHPRPSFSRSPPEPTSSPVSSA